MSDNPEYEVINRIEDALFLADVGENLINAAKRLGYADPESLATLLTARGYREVVATLRARNPIHERFLV